MKRREPGERVANLLSVLVGVAAYAYALKRKKLW